MKGIFYFLIGVTLFFSLSGNHITPAIVVNNDKVAHFFVFLFLSFAMDISFSKCLIKNLVLVMACLAFTIELSQFLFANREMSIADFGVSVLGVFVYVVIRRVVDRKLRIIKETSNVS